jgi:hypothetical protein
LICADNLKNKTQALLMKVYGFILVLLIRVSGYSQTLLLKKEDHRLSFHHSITHLNLGYEKGFQPHSSTLYAGFFSTFNSKPEGYGEHFLILDNGLAYNVRNGRWHLNNTITYAGYDRFFSFAYTSNLYFRKNQWYYVGGIGLNWEVKFMALGLYGSPIHRFDENPSFGIRLLFRPLNLLFYMGHERFPESVPKQSMRSKWGKTDVFNRAENNI